MEEHQKRVVEEKKNLDVKFHALEVFVKTDIFKGLHIDEQMRLWRQVNAMETYSLILGQRIAAF